MSFGTCVACLKVPRCSRVHSSGDLRTVVLRRIGLPLLLAPPYILLGFSSRFFRWTSFYVTVFRNPIFHSFPETLDFLPFPILPSFCPASRRAFFFWAKRVSVDPVVPPAGFRVPGGLAPSLTPPCPCVSLPPLRCCAQTLALLRYYFNFSSDFLRCPLFLI